MQANCAHHQKKAATGRSESRWQTSELINRRKNRFKTFTPVFSNSEVFHMTTARPLH